MSKAISKKARTVPRAKVPSAYADKNTVIKKAEDNDSKYQPTTMSSRNAPQFLDASDAVLKLFADSVKDLYWAENHLVKSLPKMIRSASSKELQRAIADHLGKTKVHVERLEKIFDLLQVTVQARKCDAMEGLTKEAEGVIECTDANTAARDLGIIAASRKVEHYEIAAYTSLMGLAEKLSLQQVSTLLGQTLAEELASDETLSTIAESGIRIEE